MSQVDWVALARQALKSWHLNVASVKLISRSENVAFHVLDELNEAYVLRIHRPGYHSLQELRSEQTWTRALLEAGLDVPVAVPTKAESEYAKLEFDNHHRYVGMLRWVDGVSLREGLESNRSNSSESIDTNSIAGAYGIIGAQLAQLHNQATNWEVPPDFQRHSVNADGLMGEQPFWGRFWEAKALDATQRSTLANMREEVYDLLRNLPTDRQVFSLIHSDLHTNNIILNENEVHIIDFDDSGFGWHSYDFAVALGDYESGPLREVAENAMFESYLNQRFCPSWIRELIPFFSLIRSLASIGWLDARPDLKRGDETSQNLCHKVESYFDNTIAAAKEIISEIN